MGLVLDADGSCVGADCVEYYRNKFVHAGHPGLATGPAPVFSGHVTFIYLLTICTLACAVIAVGASCLTCYHLNRVMKLTDRCEARATDGAWAAGDNGVDGATQLLAQAIQ